MRRAVGLLAIATLLSGCVAAPSGSGFGATASASIGATVDPRLAGWRADITALVPGMDRLHPKLDHGTPRAALDAAATALAGRVAGATDDELMVGVLRLVAMVSAHGCDAHTGAYVWGSGTFPVESLPLRLWWFDDGIRVVDALDPYRDLVGARLDTVAGHPIGDVLAAIEPLIPRDNDATIRLLMPRFLLMPQVLRGLGLAGDGPIGLVVVGPDAAPRSVSVEPIPMAEYNAWAGPYGLHLPVDPAVPYLSRIGDELWWQRLPDDPSTLFVQENRVERPQTSLLDALHAALHEPGLERVILDLRHNYGGEVAGVDPFVALFGDPAIDRPDRLFVITGRNTFSAASLIVARLDATTSATIVGEPMSGCPTSYGNPRELTLPFSGIVVDVSTLLEVGVAADDTRPTIAPDLPAAVTFDDWRAGVDPAVEAILGARP